MRRKRFVYRQCRWPLLAITNRKASLTFCSRRLWIRPKSKMGWDACLKLPECRRRFPSALAQPASRHKTDNVQHLIERSRVIVRGNKAFSVARECKKTKILKKKQKNPVYLKKPVFIRVFFKARFFSKLNSALPTNDLFKPYSTCVYYFKAF